jgi:hypothetical protein
VNWTLDACSKVIEAFLPLAADQYNTDGEHPPILLAFITTRALPVAVRIHSFNRETKEQAFRQAVWETRNICDGRRLRLGASVKGVAVVLDPPPLAAVALFAEAWTTKKPAGMGVVLKCPEGARSWFAPLKREIDEARLEDWSGPTPLESDAPILALLGEVSR